MVCLSLIKAKVENKNVVLGQQEMINFTVNGKVIKEIEHEGFVSAEHQIKRKIKSGFRETGYLTLP